MALVERSVPAEWHRLPPAVGSKELASMLALAGKVHRCGEDWAGPFRAAQHSLRNGTVPCVGQPSELSS